MNSRATERFWKLYSQLPPEVRDLARKNYNLWRQDHNHPSLHFKKLARGNDRFSVRIGDRYRAIGHKVGDTVEWVWIGSHSDYDKLLGR
jgi:hypothetical protein